MMDNRMKLFIGELNSFAKTAENTLSRIEQDKDGQKGLFSVFSERMLTIRGTAEQLNLRNVAHIAGLAEEIALKGTMARGNAQVRKCIGSLWDALTTVKYLLEHHGGDTGDESGEEREILINRLESTLKSLGGARQKVSEDEIAELMLKT